VPLLAKGFRPFFLLAAAFAVAAVPTWLLAFATNADFAAYLGPAQWHAHEMVFGFSTAVIAGFLLTAAGNWTGRETATGWALGLLAAAWVLGRLALLLADALPSGVAAALDLAFLPLLAAACGRALFAAKNRRNYAFLALLSALFAANLGVHLGALGVRPEWTRLGSLVGVDLVILAIVMIGGRAIPMFTRNAARVDGIRNVPWLDRAAVLGALSIVVLDAVGRHAGIAAGITGVVVLARMATWGTRHTARHPLLWVLHVGHAFVALGFLLRAVSAVPSSAALHALTAGAIGTMTLGMMTRVTLGHTGRMLAVPRSVAWGFGAVVAGALVRVIAPFMPSLYVPLVTVAGLVWSAGFAIFIAAYAGALLSPRVDGKPG